ncbi:hypothetical protein GW933_03990 [Candidatus Falkowbacteria bacterium]|nr:hypothetical protein [Candidatus Falkowbacteria bacterium]
MFILFLGYKGFSLIFSAYEIEVVSKFYLQLSAGVTVIILSLVQIYAITFFAKINGYEDGQYYLLDKEKY